MDITKLIRAGSILVLLGILSTSGLSQNTPLSINYTLPPLQNQGGIEFLTGGIGSDESQAILQEGGKWPLMLELARASAPRAEYLSDVHITIKDASGLTVLKTVTRGPYLLAKLPPGRYSLDATYEGKTLHQDLNLQKEHKKITLLWPVPKL